MSDRYLKKLRLLTREDFQAVFNGAQRFGMRQFTFLVKINPYNHPRLGISLAKRIIKTAVKRNYLKRVIRESFRTQQNVLRGLDIIVIIKQNIVLKDSDFAARLNEQWEKITQYYQNL